MATITGTSGNNSLLGTNGDDSIIPGLGKDTVNGGGGRDTLVLDYFASTDGGISYSSTSIPAFGSGFLTTYYGNNSVSFSNIERYNLTGSQSNDVLYGGNLNDTLNGGIGNDYINGGAGADVLDGGAGNDTLRRDLSAFTTGSTVDNSGTVINLIGGTVAKNFENINVTLGSGNDIIKVGLGNDTVDGGGGTDILVLDYFASTDGGISYSSTSSTSIPASGSGFLTTYYGNNSVSFSNIERYNLTGSQSNDVLYGGNLNDTLNGGIGNDYIDGGAGADVLDGGDGNDILTGAATGNGVNFIDTLTGGNGLDSFILSDSTTVFYNDGNNSNAGLSDYALIKDFNSSQDKIQLEGAASQYLLGSSPISGISGTAIYLDTNNNQAFNSTDELIAIAQGSTGLNLRASYFAYV